MLNGTNKVHVLETLANYPFSFNLFLLYVAIISLSSYLKDFIVLLYFLILFLVRIVTDVVKVPEKTRAIGWFNYPKKLDCRNWG